MTTALAEIEVLPPIRPASQSPNPAPSWARARQLIAEIGDWHKIIELGRVLQALREEYFAMGARTDMSTSSARGRGSQVVDKPTQDGWQEVVRRELAMSPQSALRSIERGLQV